MNTCGLAKYLCVASLTFVVGIAAFVVWYSYRQPPRKTALEKPAPSVENAARLKNDFRNLWVEDGIIRGGGEFAVQKYVASDGTEIQESIFWYLSAGDAEKAFNRTLRSAKKIIEREILSGDGVQPQKKRVVAVLSKGVIIFGINGESTFYSIEAPTLEYALAFEESNKR